MSFREEKYVRCVHPYYLPHGSRDLATTIEQGDDQAGCSALGAAPGGASASPGPQAVLPRLALWLAALLLAVRLLAALLLAARLLAALCLAAWLLAALRLAAWLLGARQLWAALLLAAQLQAAVPLVARLPAAPVAQLVSRLDLCHPPLLRGASRQRGAWSASGGLECCGGGRGRAGAAGGGGDC
jgi:uncharacterized membrane protein YgcG